MPGAGVRGGLRLGGWSTWRGSLGDAGRQPSKRLGPLRPEAEPFAANFRMAIRSELFMMAIARPCNQNRVTIMWTTRRPEGFGSCPNAQYDRSNSWLGPALG